MVESCLVWCHASGLFRKHVSAQGRGIVAAGGVRGKSIESAWRGGQEAPAKGNSLRGTGDRAQGRAPLQAALERIRQAARRDISRPAPGRHDRRQEPSAVVPHAGICPGGAPQGVSLPGRTTSP